VNTLEDTRTWPKNLADEYDSLKELYYDTFPLNISSMLDCPMEFVPDMLAYGELLGELLFERWEIESQNIRARRKSPS
jgi:hypothetical protein